MLINQNDLVKDIVRVFIFENWTRFYHAVDKAGHTWLEVPEDVVAAISEKHPDLAPFLTKANNQIITQESCRVNVGEFVCELLDGSKYPPGKVTEALDSKAFKIEMHMFSVWQHGHEGYLDQNALGFDDWLEMFANWRLMDEVKAFQDKLEQTPEQADPVKTTTH